MGQATAQLTGIPGRAGRFGSQWPATQRPAPVPGAPVSQPTGLFLVSISLSRFVVWMTTNFSAVSNGTPVLEVNCLVQPVQQVYLLLIVMPMNLASALK